MFIEDLIEQYSEEIRILNIETDDAYTIHEVAALVDQCESYRREKNTKLRITQLEQKVNDLEIEINHLKLLVKLTG